MDRKTRIEENEKLFREVNERVEQLQDSLKAGSEPQWVCECGDKACFEKLTVPVDEYRDVRAHDGWFLIRPGHEKLGVERLVSQRGGYSVVEKDDVS